MILFEAIHFNYKIVKYNDFILQDFHHITKTYITISQVHPKLADTESVTSEAGRDQVSYIRG